MLRFRTILFNYCVLYETDTGDDTNVIFLLPAPAVSRNLASFNTELKYLS